MRFRASQSLDLTSLRCLRSEVVRDLEILGMGIHGRIQAFSVFHRDPHWQMVLVGDIARQSGDSNSTGFRHLAESCRGSP